MAIVQNPIIGRASGQAAGMVFTTQFGKNVMKSKPVSVANPKSDKQKERRSAITQIVAIYRAVSSVIQSTFAALAVGMSAYNAFASYNLLNAFTYSGAAPATLTDADILFSKGTIATTPILSSSASDGSKTVTVTYAKTTAGAGQSLTDKAVMVVMNQDTKVYYGEILADTRVDSSASIELSEAANEGDVIDIWLSFISDDGATVSDSVHTTTVVSA